MILVCIALYEPDMMCGGYRIFRFNQALELITEQHVISMYLYN